MQLTELVSGDHPGDEVCDDLGIVTEVDLDGGHLVDVACTL